LIDFFYSALFEKDWVSQSRVMYLHVVTGVLNIRDDPVIGLVFPVRSCLNLHVLNRGDELINNQVLEPDLTGQLPDAIH